MTALSAAPRAELRPRTRLVGGLRERGIGASILVAALTAGFGVFLVEVTVYIGALLQADPYIGDSDTLALVVAILSVLLVGVAMYVAAIVTANTFSTIIAGRIRQIAMLRLLGASARSQRSRVAAQGLAVGSIGAGIGLVVGLAASGAGAAIGERMLERAPAGFSGATRHPAACRGCDLDHLGRGVDRRSPGAHGHPVAGTRLERRAHA